MPTPPTPPRPPSSSSSPGFETTAPVASSTGKDAPRTTTDTPEDASGRWYAKARGKAVRIHLHFDAELQGVLVSVARYDLILRRASEGEPILVAKHAVDWAEVVGDAQ